jgi:rod shape-determining protein MreD
MAEKIRVILLVILLVCFALILQSTLFTLLSIAGVKPDLAMIILIFTSYRRGRFIGELGGFFGGLIEDFVSLTPLGFHAVIKTFIGFLCGLTQGAIVIDRVLLPVVFAGAATIIKLLSSWLLSLIFSISSSNIYFFHYKTLIEILYNALLSPFVFAALGLFKSFQARDKEES